MQPTIKDYLTTCHLLGERYIAVTGGNAKVELKASNDSSGGVQLTYYRRSLEGGALSFEPTNTVHLSILRAIDSILLHTAEAINTNLEGTELAGVEFVSGTESAGFARAYYWCPAWERSYYVDCSYSSKTVDTGMKVQLSLVGPENFREDQRLGWDCLYEAGIVGQLGNSLSFAAQAMAQLILINREFKIKATAVLLPGKHRQFTQFPNNEGVVLSFLNESKSYWNIFPKDGGLSTLTDTGPLILSTAQRLELNGALARWQAIPDLLGDKFRDNQRNR
jgi:hypothetical protein